MDERFRCSVSSQHLGSLDVFRSTVEVMLGDGVLTREEKRLIIKLGSVLKLAPEEPAYVYSCIQSGEASRSGEPVSPEDMRDIYTKVFEVAIVNASLSATNSVCWPISEINSTSATTFTKKSSTNCGK